MFPKARNLEWRIRDKPLLGQEKDRYTNFDNNLPKAGKWTRMFLKAGNLG